jgi:glucose/arabinose dehydrogenase
MEQQQQQVDDDGGTDEEEETQEFVDVPESFVAEAHLQMMVDGPTDAVMTSNVGPGIQLDFVEAGRQQEERIASGYAVHAHGAGLLADCALHAGVFMSAGRSTWSTPSRPPCRTTLPLISPSSTSTIRPQSSRHTER